jgi:hypothetical protein
VIDRGAARSDVAAPSGDGGSGIWGRAAHALVGMIAAMATQGCDGGGGFEGLAPPSRSALPVSSSALSQAAREWLAPDASSQSPASSQSAASSKSVASELVAKGARFVPVAQELARMADDLVDVDASIEPIVRDLDAPEVGPTDARIAAMDRVEVLDGVTVGFEKLSKSSLKAMEDEQAVLLSWRRERRLFGVLVRSRRRLDLEALVRAAPRLVASVERATRAASP